MFISRIVVRNFRNLRAIDIRTATGVTAVVGENNAGKSNLIHAIRLAIDANLSSVFRQLSREDFTAGVDMTRPAQILIAVEFSDYQSNENEEALLFGGGHEGIARIVYRFRPKPAIRTAITGGEHLGEGLTLDDYRREIRSFPRHLSTFGPAMNAKGKHPRSGEHGPSGESKRHEQRQARINIDRARGVGGMKNGRGRCCRLLAITRHAQTSRTDSSSACSSAIA
jgi:hypothetical protein